jgi:hypothetical protein
VEATESEAPAHAGRRDHLHDGARDRDLAHGQQVAQREVQADAEHEQHHPDLGQLRREVGVRHEPRREGTDHHAGQQVAHQRRQLHAGGDEPKDEREAERGGDRRDQRDVVVHVPIYITAAAEVEKPPAGGFTAAAGALRASRS